MKEIDPITLELVRCRLESGAQQMAVTLWKSSFSTVIREVLDYSTAIFDVNGNMVAQSAQLPFQMMTMTNPLKCLTSRGFSWSPGDVVLLNDPYQCDGQHLPDFMVFRPVFCKNRHVGFAGSIAHMIDVGGGAPGSYLATATEIFQEGLRIPAVKIHKEGKPDQEILSMIRLNVREPDKLMGDLAAMIASTKMGEHALLESVERYGLEMIIATMKRLLDDTEKLLRLRIQELTSGVFNAFDYIDDDGITDEPIEIRAAVGVEGEKLTIDFSGSSAQVKGPVNVTQAMTEASVTYVIMALLGEGVPKNDGYRRIFSINAPERSVLNALSPAPVASRVTTCHRIVDVMMQAFAKILPDRVMAGYYGVSNICNLGGLDASNGNPWVHFEIEVGGWGARFNSDGLDGYSAHIHNLCNTPIEVVEVSKPLRIERYTYIPDSGGKGKFRGGLGLRRDIRVLEDNVTLNLLGDRCKFPPKGISGGGSGRIGCYVLNPGSPNERVMPNKLSNYAMSRGDVISIQTPGGGGWGSPDERPLELSEIDFIDGKSKSRNGSEEKNA